MALTCTNNSTEASMTVPKSARYMPTGGHMSSLSARFQKASTLIIYAETGRASTRTILSQSLDKRTSFADSQRQQTRSAPGPVSQVISTPRRTPIFARTMGGGCAAPVTTAVKMSVTDAMESDNN